MFNVLLSLDHVFSVIYYSGQAEFHMRVLGLFLSPYLPMNNYAAIPVA